MINFRIDSSIEIQILEEHHAAELYNLTNQNRGYLRTWLPWLDSNNTVADTREFIKSSFNRFLNSEGLVAGIWFKGDLAGVISYNSIDWSNKVATIGYWLGVSFQGQGLMTRSCRALTDYAFTELRLNRVEIHCATGNKKSRAIPERLGYKQTEIIQQAEWLYEHFVDHVVYAIHKSEWRELMELWKSPRTRGSERNF